MQKRFYISSAVLGGALGAGELLVFFDKDDNAWFAQDITALGDPPVKLSRSKLHKCVVYANRIMNLLPEY